MAGADKRAAIRVIDHEVPEVAVVRGSHLCAMYRGPTERDAIVGPFLGAGLRAGHTCFIAVSENDPASIRAAVGDGGPGELIVKTAVDSILDRERFDIDRIIAFWDETVRGALDAEGVGFVRLSAEATWWTRSMAGVDDLLRYEARLNTFAPSHPQSILCLYDIGELGADVVFDALQLHPRIWLSGLIMENPFYDAVG